MFSSNCRREESFYSQWILGSLSIYSEQPEHDSEHWTWLELEWMRCVKFQCSNSCSVCLQVAAVTSRTGSSSTNSCCRVFLQRCLRTTARTTWPRPRSCFTATPGRPTLTSAPSPTPSSRRCFRHSHKRVILQGPASASCTSSTATAPSASATASSRNCSWRRSWCRVLWGSSRAWTWTSASTTTTTTTTTTTRRRRRRRSTSSCETVDASCR